MKILLGGNGTSAVAHRQHGGSEQDENGVDDAMSADKHVKTAFDVWNETHAITKMLKTSVCTKWVKGHQDKYRNEEQGGVGPMPLEAHYNILVDRRAERRRQVSTVTLPTLQMPTDAASVKIGDSFIMTKIDEHVGMNFSFPA